MQEIFYISVLSIGSFAMIFVLTKIMGYREMSQLSMFDYINSITIGSIAADLATALDEDYTALITAMIVYSLATVFLSWITSKSMKVRKIVEGKPLILMDHGELFRDNLKKAKIDVAEFLVQCRANGYFDVSKLETVILEGNGKVSFLPKAADRPATPEDFGMTPQQEHMVANVILDGKIMEKNLRHTGNNKKWLLEQIRGQGTGKIEDILLATCDRNNQVTVFMKNSKKNMEDFLM